MIGPKPRLRWWSANYPWSKASILGSAAACALRPRWFLPGPNCAHPEPEPHRATDFIGIDCRDQGITLLGWLKAVDRPKRPD